MKRSDLFLEETQKHISSETDLFSLSKIVAH